MRALFSVLSLFSLWSPLLVLRLIFTLWAPFGLRNQLLIVFISELSDVRRFKKIITKSTNIIPLLILLIILPYNCRVFKCILLLMFIAAYTIFLSVTWLWWLSVVGLNCLPCVSDLLIVLLFLMILLDIFFLRFWFWGRINLDLNVLLPVISLICFILLNLVLYLWLNIF